MLVSGMSTTPCPGHGGSLCVSVPPLGGRVPPSPLLTSEAVHSGGQGRLTLHSGSSLQPGVCRPLVCLESRARPGPRCHGGAPGASGWQDGGAPELDRGGGVLGSGAGHTACCWHWPGKSNGGGRGRGSAGARVGQAAAHALRFEDLMGVVLEALLLRPDDGASPARVFDQRRPLVVHTECFQVTQNEQAGLGSGYGDVQPLPVT